MKTKHKRVLGWTGFFYLIFALILLPWTLYLAQTLPKQHLAIHWDVSWVGLNIVMFAALLATGIFSYLGSRWIVISSSILGSLLLLDAWFDILSARTGNDFRQSLFLAFFVEIPLAVASFVIAGRALVKNETRIVPRRNAKTKSRQR